MRRDSHAAAGGRVVALGTGAILAVVLALAISGCCTEGRKAKTTMAVSAVELSHIPADGWTALVVSSRGRITSDLTLPQNVLLKFENGGCLEVDSGATLTVAGPIEAPPVRIFSGGGNVLFGPGRVTEVYPQWWGAQADDALDDTAAIQSAIDSLAYKGRCAKEHVPPNTGVVLFPAGRYLISSRLTLYDGTTMEGRSPNRTILQAAARLPVMLQRPDLTPPPEGKEYNYDTRVNGVRIAGLTFNGNKQCELGLDFTNVGYSQLENVTVRECATGIRMGGLAMHNVLTNISVAYCATGIEINRCSEHGLVLGGHFGNCATGLLVNFAQGYTIYGTSFEGYRDAAIDVKGGDSVNMDHLWFAAPAPATAIRIAPGVSGCAVANPRFHGATPPKIDDLGTDTLVLSGVRRLPGKPE